MAIQPFAVLEGTRGYPPPEKRFSRKSLGVSTVCARTPVNPADRPAAREEASGEGKVANYHSKDAVASPRAIASQARALPQSNIRLNGKAHTHHLQDSRKATQLMVALRREGAVKRGSVQRRLVGQPCDSTPKAPAR